MPDILDRLKSALSDRYAIEEKLGEGGMATVTPGASPGNGSRLLLV